MTRDGGGRTRPAALCVDAGAGIAAATAARWLPLRGCTGRAVRETGDAGAHPQVAISARVRSGGSALARAGHTAGHGRRDARGRKQYRYHADGAARADDSKFGRMAEFGKALPALRRCLRRDLALPGLPREKCWRRWRRFSTQRWWHRQRRVRARQQRYGLATLRNRHASFSAGARCCASAARAASSIKWAG